MKTAPKKTGPRPAPGPATSSLRWRPEDWALIEALRQRTGVASVSELARMALRALAAKEGLQ